jgi:hypothetical protein
MSPETHFIQNIIIGASIIVVGWIITNIVLFILKNFKLRNAILTDISFKIEELKECKDFLLKYSDELIRINETITRAPRFTKDELILFRTIFPTILNCFNIKNYIKIIKFYGIFDEINMLIEGLFGDFQKFKDDKRILEENDVVYLNRKKDRIIKLIDIILQKVINKISDLPNDYSDRVSPTSLVIK